MICFVGELTEADQGALATIDARYEAGHASEQLDNLATPRAKRSRLDEVFHRKMKAGFCLQAKQSVHCPRIDLKGTKMMTRLTGLMSVLSLPAFNAAAFAGSSSGGGPAGDGGSSGSEPALYALILLSLVPAYLMAQRARSARPIPVKRDR